MRTSGQRPAGRIRPRWKLVAAVVAAAVTTASGALAVGVALAQPAGAATPYSVVQAWGEADRGELGNGTAPMEQAAPATVALPHGIVRQVSGGEDHALALMADGTVWAWGDNSSGELGVDPVQHFSTVPVRVAGLSHIVQVVADARASLALRSDGTVLAWGNNGAHELGSALPAQRTAPAPVPGLTHVTQLSAQSGHAVARRSDGTVWAWGSNVNGSLGTGTDGTTAKPVPGLSGVTQVAAGWAHALALRSNGTVWAWGNNELGQLGRGTTGPQTASFPPAPVAKLAHVVQVAAETYDSFAVLANGTVAAWGTDFGCELGDGVSVCTGAAVLPVAVKGLSGVVQVAAGNAHVAALRRDGSVWAWGSNAFEALGVGGTDRSTAQAVAGVKGAVQVAALSFGTLAVSGPPVVRARAAVGGTAAVGHPLTCEVDVVGSPTLHYAWLRTGSAISGATHATYLARTADLKRKLSCRVTAANARGSAGSTSLPVTIRKH